MITRRGMGLAVALAGLLFSPPPARAQGRLGPANPRPAMPDDVYLQETGMQIPTPEPLTAVAVVGDTVWTGSPGGVRRLEGRRLEDPPSLRLPVRRLVSAGNTLWAISSTGLHRLQSSGWVQVGEGSFADLCEHRGEIHAIAGNRLWVFRGEKLEQLPGECRFAMNRVVSHQESLVVQGSGRVTTYRTEVFGGRDAYGFPADESWDWGALPSPETRDMVSLGNRLLIATARGLGVLRGMSLSVVDGRDGLPVEDTLCLAGGFTNDFWVGTSAGAVRQVGSEFQYFAGRRWLPHDRVNAIATGSNSVYFATEGGLGVIRYQPYTLAKKAAYYERHLDAWGQKRLGLIHKLEWDGPLGEFVREAGDNDGGYSGYYLAAQSYRWAVTRDPVARREATNTFHGLCWLEEMTGIAGFPARSVWVKGERGHKAGHGSGGYAAEWHDTVDGMFEWKGDTSSDELCSHFYAIGRFLELAAEGAEVPKGKNHLARIARHLIDHQWKLVDLDGQPTRWGRWDPEYFLTDEGRYDRGLQAVELLSFIRTAGHFTGDAVFADAYRQLVALGYPDFTLRARNTFPPDSVLHFLDELSFWSYWNLLRYETDPELRSLYRRGYERGYEVVRMERNPWFNFVYGALTGSEFEAGPAVAHLREWPLDLRIWSYRNSHRSDLRTPPGYVALKGGRRAFSPREAEPLRWDAWTMKADGGTGGNDVVEPGSWLLAYWMGRYHGFIAAPAVTDPSLVSLAPGEVPEGGAKPYDGPPRPEGH